MSVAVSGANKLAIVLSKNNLACGAIARLVHCPETKAVDFTPTGLGEGDFSDLIGQLLVNRLTNNCRFQGLWWGESRSVFDPKSINPQQ